jgi:hypothetical protein
MPSITLNAHFDGRSIVLDGPFELPNDARLLATVVAPAIDVDREQWANLAVAGIAAATDWRPSA